MSNWNFITLALLLAFAVTFMVSGGFSGAGSDRYEFVTFESMPGIAYRLNKRTGEMIFCVAANCSEVETPDTADGAPAGRVGAIRVPAP